MSANAGDLFTTMQYLMWHLETAATEVGMVLPARRYVTVGGSVYDCEQAVVTTLGSDPGIVSADPGAINLLGNCDVPWNMQFEVAIVVCAQEKPTGRNGDGPPTVESIEADANTMSSAYAVLRTMVDNIVASGDLGAPGGNVQFGQPQGGLIATVLALNTNAWIDESWVPA